MSLRIAGALVVAAALTWSTAVRAQPPTRVAIADAADDPAVAIRVRAELAAAGVVVVDIEAWPTDPTSASVAELLSAAGATAAVRVHGEVLEVWVVDREAATLRERMRADPADAVSEMTVAVRAAEVVRAALASLGRVSGERRASAPPEETPVPQQPPPQPESRAQFALDLGAGISASPGGIGAVPTLVAGARWFPFDGVGMGVLVVASPFSSTIDASEGSACVWTGLAGGGIVLVPVFSDGWGLRLEAGIAGAWLHMQGSAEPPYVSGSDTVAAASAYIRPGLRVQLTRMVAIQGGAIAAATLSRVVVAFAGRETASWGRPVVVASTGVELAF
jgi:hypothetical protein